MWPIAFALAIAGAEPAFVQIDAQAEPRQCPSVAGEGSVEFLAAVLRDRSLDEQAKQDAALSLGCIGGDRAVRSLESALKAASPETRSTIAHALGHTRSRLAVPVLIGMFADDSARSDVCGALVTLTHRTWCDGGDDDVALRRAWRRWWSQMKSRVEIYGPDECESPALACAPIVR